MVSALVELLTRAEPGMLESSTFKVSRFHSPNTVYLRTASETFAVV